MEKLAGDLLLGLNFVKLDILSTSFIDCLYEELGELRSRSLGLKARVLLKVTIMLEHADVNSSR